jgi:hypothetical protein
MDDTVENTPRQWLFWAVFIALMAVVGWYAWKILSREVYDLLLWQKLIEDVDHRWKPYEKPGINGDGLRSEREADEFREEDFTVIVAGDSYTYGFMLKPESALPAQLESLARQHFAAGEELKVVNFGWTSSSPYLSLRLLRDKGKKYKPDVVLLVLDATDFKDDFFYKSVIYRKGHYGFIIDYPVTGHIVRQIARRTDHFTGWQQALLGYPEFSTYFVFHQPYEKSLPYFDNVRESLEAMNDYISNELGARFYVFVPPRHWQYTDRESPESWEKHNYVEMGPHVLNNFRYFEEVGDALPFPVVPLLEEFRQSGVFPTTFRKDSHWNPDGARLAAELVFEKCLNLGCFEGLAPAAP